MWPGYMDVDGSTYHAVNVSLCMLYVAINAHCCMHVWHAHAWAPCVVATVTRQMIRKLFQISYDTVIYINC